MGTMEELGGFRYEIKMVLDEPLVEFAESWVTPVQVNPLGSVDIFTHGVECRWRLTIMVTHVSTPLSYL